MKKFFSFFFLSILFLLFSKTAFAQGVQTPQETKYEAVVVKVVEEKNVKLFSGGEKPYQKLQIKITSGDLKGKEVAAELGKIIVSNDKQKLKPQDKIIVSRLKKADGTDQFLIEDHVRRTPLYILGIVFFLFVLVIGGLRGISSFLGLIISFVVLIKYIIPLIAKGYNPVLIAVTGSFMILIATLYLAHGVSKKTTAAVIGTSLSLIFTSFLAWFFVDFTKLTGFVSEQASFLYLFPGAKIDLSGLLLGGIIIGALGVLDDITISQAACVYELHNANNKLSFFDLYKRGLNIGKDHIASLVNTLVLAYAGVSLPLFLLFTLNGGEPFGILINREIISSEIVRTLVGSIGLVSAVPITTAIAAGFIKWGK